MKCGIIYIAVGDIYVRESIYSAHSVRLFHPDIPITLYTDDEKQSEKFPGNVVIINRDIHPLKIKVRCLSASPYENTLFLDTDTKVIKPINELFRLLETYDLCLANAPNVDFKQKPQKLIDYIRDGFYNTGVILYKQTDAFKTFHLKWLTSILEQDDNDIWPGHNCDQFYFNRLIRNQFHVKCNVRMGVFPNIIYNVRPTMIKAMEADGTIADAKILHAHAKGTYGILKHK